MGKRNTTPNAGVDAGEAETPENYLVGLVGRYASNSDANTSLKRARGVLRKNGVTASKVGGALRIEEFGMSIRFENGRVIIGNDSQELSFEGARLEQLQQRSGSEKQKRRERKERREERRLVEAHYTLDELIEFLPGALRKRRLEEVDASNVKRSSQFFWVGFPAVRIRDQCQELDTVIDQVFERYRFLANAEPKMFITTEQGKLLMLGPLRSA